MKSKEADIGDSKNVYSTIKCNAYSTATVRKKRYVNFHPPKPLLQTDNKKTKRKTTIEETFYEINSRATPEKQLTQ